MAKYRAKIEWEQVADKEEVKRLVVVLREYETASGQAINLEKSATFFSKNTDEQLRMELRDLLGIVREGVQERYLGLPSVVGRSKKEVFSYIERRVSDNIQSWKGKLLSAGGKEISKFWWADSNGKDKTHWINWKQLTKVKANGGLGFRDIHAFNLAFLAKHGW
ncbi:uncharacterized protein LOC132281088 [Cornus florida]|uniref:uncharacterized protein LOC132281088 n=1 Tax=Cornus florida TaxID=4283 RepID=UPI00289C94FE|nr:uncharacterized protein LOC132281088 [Cornus florida]